MTETRVDPEELRKVAKAIGSIMDDYDSVFRNLGTLDPNAGKFDVAEWLEDLFVDRRDAIVTHAKYLRLAFDEINAGLYKIADAFEDVDMSNADAVAAASGLARTAVEGMADAEFTPTKVKSKDDYDTGDDEDLGDKKTYSIDDGKVEVKFDPDDIHDMDDALEVDELGKNEDEEIDIGDGETIKGADDGLTLDVDDDDDDDDDNENSDNNDPKPPPTGEHFTRVEPDQSVYKDWEEKQGPPSRTYRSYVIDGELQTDSKGRTIYWYNSEPYTYHTSKPPFRKWTE